MTTSKKYVDGSTARFCARFFKGKTWKSACVKAAEWVWEIRAAEFSGGNVFFIDIAAVLVPDNRVNRYYGIFKKKPCLGWVEEKQPPVVDDYLSKGNKALYYGAIEVNFAHLPEVIDFCRVHRNAFPVISVSREAVRHLTENLAKLRLEGRDARIDYLEINEFIISAGLVPIRVWESHPELSVVVEIYGNLNRSSA